MRLKLCLVIFPVLFLFTNALSAEGWQSAEKRARMQTKYLKNNLSISGEQVEKIQKANLKAEEARNEFVESTLKDIPPEKRKSGDVKKSINKKVNSIENQRDKRIKNVLKGDQEDAYMKVKSDMLDKTKNKLEAGDPQGGIELLY